MSLVNIGSSASFLSFLFAKNDPLAEMAENRWVRTFRTLSATVKAKAVSMADYVIAGGIAVVFMLIGVIRLGVPSEQIFDEVYHARTAMEYIAGVTPTSGPTRLWPSCWRLCGSWSSMASSTLPPRSGPSIRPSPGAFRAWYRRADPAHHVRPDALLV